MPLSKLASSIPASPTLALNDEARRLRENGEPVVNLGIGEPANAAPPAAIQSASDQLKTGKVKYSPAGGIPALKDAIIRYTKANYGRTVGRKNIVVTQGAKLAIFNVLYTLCNPGDEVIIFAPYWVSYPEIIKMVNAVPVIVKTGDKDFLPEVSEIGRVVNSRTKAIIVNSPNNPSGAVYPSGLIEELVKLCEKRGIYLLCDDIYHKLVFDDCVAVPAYQLSKKGIEETRIIVINGVAKLYGMTGFRIGWTVSSQEIAEVITNIQAQTITCVSPVTQAAAQAALDGDQSVVEDLRLDIQHNRDVLMDEIGSFSKVRCARPKGTFYALIDFRDCFQETGIRSSVELASFLLKKVLVVTVPGDEFGTPGYLRISYAGATEDVLDGIRRIIWALDPAAPRELKIGTKTVVKDWL